MFSGRLLDVFKTYLPDVFKTSSRRLGRRKIVTLKTCWKHYQDVFKTSKCLLGSMVGLSQTTESVEVKSYTVTKHGVLTKHYARDLMGATPECWEWPWTSHGNKNWETNNSMEHYQQFRQKLPIECIVLCPTLYRIV